MGLILDLLRERTRVDFLRYHPATIRRRVLNHMLSIGTTDLAQYVEVLRESRAEALRLLARITIKFSRFYRDAITFDTLRSKVLPDLKQASAGAPLRVWSAGCGNGEEAYTLAMLLAEADTPGVVEASDVDPAALSFARTGRYAIGALSELPVGLRDRYLEPDGSDHRVSAELRERVRFSRHDLAGPTPFVADGGRLFDLVCCRNVLIYLKREVQEQVLEAVHGSVRSGGYLCLGEAEWPTPATRHLLEPLGRQSRVFRTDALRSNWLQ